MNSVIIIGMICVAIIVAVALGVLAFLVLRPAGTKTRKAHPTQVAATQKKTWQGWVAPVIIALILAAWTVAGALFFLAVVWVMKLNPKPYAKEISYPGPAEIITAKGPYTWLFLSPLLTIPALVIILFNFDSALSSVNERVIAAIIPMVFHLPLLARLDPKSAFVFRHTQQAFLLVALRAGLTALAVAWGDDNALWLFLLGNGSLWLFGTLWARNQAIRGECWWLKLRGEAIAPKTEAAPKFDLTRTVGLSPKQNLEKSREYIQHYQKPAACDYALAAFRLGDREERAQAAWLLEVLEEVETF